MWRFLLITSLLVIAGGGCTDHSTYSGDFSVINHSDQDTRILDWEGFGLAQPGRGNLHKNQPGNSGLAETHFGRLKHVPSKTTVIWVAEGSPDEHRQEIDLEQVIPQGAAGTTVFTLDAEGIWKVKFVPK